MPHRKIRHLADTVEAEKEVQFLNDPTYQEALDWMGSRARIGEKDGLRNIRALLDLLGNPQEQLACFHITGTNGKGSTANAIASVLEAAGYRVGLFMSPYIETFRERFQINHELIAPDLLKDLIRRVRPLVDDLESEGIIPTHFEIVTAIGFHYFAEQNVDFAVIEVGVGGWEDSTNVIAKPIASLIATIDYDHMEYLGNSLPEIAAHKAGILKSGCPGFLYPNPPEAMAVVRAYADAIGAPLAGFSPEEVSEIEVSPRGTGFLFRGQRYKLAMVGEQQAYNAALVVLALTTLRERNVLNFTEDALHEGLAGAKLIGRIEVLQEKPLLILDGSHNPQGMRTLIRNLRHIPYKRLILLCGFFIDKNYQEMLQMIAPLADEIIATEIAMPRKLPAEELAEELQAYNANVRVEKNPDLALAQALKAATADDLVLCCGSLYLVGELRKRYFADK